MLVLESPREDGSVPYNEFLNKEIPVRDNKEDSSNGIVPARLFESNQIYMAFNLSLHLTPYQEHSLCGLNHLCVTIIVAADDEFMCVVSLNEEEKAPSSSLDIYTLLLLLAVVIEVHGLVS
mmetsp:Transcript_28014/g.40099  ORF Transcript_28014/g.40099 Transcript_28014/m.40099 type:complete len:121 (+) Transcript_28014:1691-2053(+)